MRISYFNYHYDIAGRAIGAATQVRDLAAALVRQGHEVEVQFRAARRPGAERGYLGLKQVPWLRRYGHFPRLLWRNVAFLRQELRLLQGFRPDVLLAVSSYGNISPLLAARRLGLPLVLFVEAPLEYEYALFFPEFYHYPGLGRLLEGLKVRGARRVVCISEVLKGYLMRYGAPATRLHVAPNGVDHLAFQPRPADPALQQRFGLQNRVVLGYIGSFEYFGDIPRFLDLVQTVAAAHPRAVFLMVGQGPLGDALRDQAAARGLAGHFIFPGRTPHSRVPDWLSVMDIVISPYKDDYLFYGSSMKLLEYMAAGKAVLFPALGQIKEVIAEGYNGLLHEPGDYGAMTGKLLELIGNRRLRRQLGANARRTIEGGWTWDHQAARISRVLELAAAVRN
jgi:glycosyltransferase involved in cell wall biosynthesis